MTTAQHIRRNAELLREAFPTARVCFFGHSHAQKLYEVAGDEVRELAVDQRYHLSPDRLYFINAGSVDAPRKREEKLAEFAVLDAQASTGQFHRVRYDAVATENSRCPKVMFGVAQKAIRKPSMIGWRTNL